MTIYTVTFDVQRGDVVVQDSTTGRVCFTCIFVEGSQSLGCSIEYLCTRTEYNGQLNISRPLGSQNVTKCIDGIYTSDYNISFYDIEHDGDISNQPAYQLIQQSIERLSLESRIPKGMICITTTYEVLILFRIITDSGVSSSITMTGIIIVIVIMLIIVGEFIKLLLLS